MKTVLLFLLSVVSVSSTYGQFDDKFYFPKKAWNNIDTVKYEEVSIKTDTSLLNGIFLKPSVKTPVATILYFHGAGGNVTTYLPIIKPLVDAGFQVFEPDMQGYGKSTGKPTHADIAHDAQFVLDYLLKRNDVKGTKLVVMGVSMGTQIAAHIARNNPGKVNALVLEGTISSFTDIAKSGAPDQQKQMIDQFVTSPYSAKEDIKYVSSKKLIVHSTEDKQVPFDEGKLVFANAVDPKEFWAITGEHLDGINLFRYQYISKIKALLK